MRDPARVNIFLHGQTLPFSATLPLVIVRPGDAPFLAGPQLLNCCHSTLRTSMERCRSVQFLLIFSFKAAQTNKTNYAERRAGAVLSRDDEGFQDWVEVIIPFPSETNMSTRSSSRSKKMRLMKMACPSCPSNCPTAEGLQALALLFWSPVEVWNLAVFCRWSCLGNFVPVDHEVPCPTSSGHNISLHDGRQ